MFKNQLVFKIDAKEVVNFSRLLGRFGLKFEIGKARCPASNIDPDNKCFYREFRVTATKRQTYKLFEAINMANGRYFMR